MGLCPAACDKRVFTVSSALGPVGEGAKKCDKPPIQRENAKEDAVNESKTRLVESTESSGQIARLPEGG